MDSKYCSSCLQKHVLSSFLKNTSSDLGGKIFSTCIPCRAKNAKKRKALKPLCPNVLPKRRTTRPAEVLARPKLSALPRFIPRPLASALPPLLDGHPGPLVLPLPESRPFFEARTNNPLLPVQRQLILPAYPPRIQPIQPQALPPQPQSLQPVPHHVQPQLTGILPAERRRGRQISHAIATRPLGYDPEPTRPPLVHGFKNLRSRLENRTPSFGPLRRALRRSISLGRPCTVSCGSQLRVRSRICPSRPYNPYKPFSETVGS